MKPLTPYLNGFIISLALTIAAYALVEVHINSSHETISHPVLLALIFVLAFLQMGVQLFFFLHIGESEGRRWKITVFSLMFGLVLIIVVGSMWIMDHLNYNMMASPKVMEQYMKNQQGGF